MAKVLLIEDDGDTAEEVILELERYGHVVTHALSGSHGLLVARESFDVLVVDRLLPGLEGLDVIKALRHEGDSHASAYRQCARQTGRAG